MSQRQELNQIAVELLDIVDRLDSCCRALLKEEKEKKEKGRTGLPVPSWMKKKIMEKAGR